MFYVIDLSKPRKAIQNKVLGKYDDIVLHFKLHPVKFNKAVVVAAAVGIALVAGYTINAAELMDTAQYNYLVNHFVNDLKYPRDLAERLINDLSLKDFNELYARVEHHDKWMRFGGNQILGASNQITSKIIGSIKEIFEFYARLQQG